MTHISENDSRTLEPEFLNRLVKLLSRYCVFEFEKDTIVLLYTVNLIRKVSRIVRTQQTAPCEIRISELLGVSFGLSLKSKLPKVSFYDW